MEIKSQTMPFMKNLLRVVLLIAAMAQCPVVMATETEPPRDFLPASSKRLQEVLATPILGDFQKTPLREAIDRIAKQMQLNVVVGVKPSPDGSELTFTAHFERTPLREALFQISRELNVKVEWLYLPEDAHRPRGISIHN
jgi:hypothetical protein